MTAQSLEPQRLKGTEGVFLPPPWLRSNIPPNLIAVARFIREFGADHDRPNTSKTRWGVLCRIQHEVGGGPLLHASQAQVRTWWFGIGQMRLDGAGLRSPATRRALLDHLRAFVRWAIAQQLRTDDPTIGLPGVRVPRREPRPADRAEVDRVLATAKGSARLAIQLASDLGLRCCEIALLTRDDLVVDDAGPWLWTTRKGGHRMRVVVPDEAAAAIAELAPGQPVVPNRSGGHLSPKGVTKLISRTFSRAGSPWRAHTLRHLAATELLGATGNLAAVADQLGHRDIRTTAGYARADAGTVRGSLASRTSATWTRSRPPSAEDPPGPPLTPA